MHRSAKPRLSQAALSRPFKREEVVLTDVGGSTRDNKRKKTKKKVVKKKPRKELTPDCRSRNSFRSKSSAKNMRKLSPKI